MLSSFPLERWFTTANYYFPLSGHNFYHCGREWKPLSAIPPIFILPLVCDCNENAHLVFTLGDNELYILGVYIY
jgi:hypothetical protein